MLKKKKKKRGEIQDFLHSEGLIKVTKPCAAPCWGTSCVTVKLWSVWWNTVHMWNNVYRSSLTLNSLALQMSATAVWIWAACYQGDQGCERRDQSRARVDGNSSNRSLQTCRAEKHLRTVQRRILREQHLKPPGRSCHVTTEINRSLSFFYTLVLFTITIALWTH